MITKFSKIGALIALLLSWQPASFAQQDSYTFTNVAPIRLSPDVAEVVQMAQSGTSNSVILTHIKLCPRMYDLSAEDVVNLEKLNIPRELALAMIEHDAALARTTLPKPASTEASTKPTEETKDKESAAPTSVRQPVRRPEGVVVLPIPEPSGSGTNRATVPRRRWTSSTVVDKTPPPPKLELISDAPGRDYIWIKGNWAWKGRWTWEEGYWEQRPGPDMVWVDGLWSRHGKGWIWIPGKWR